MQDFEKLGVFYLGRTYDLNAQKATNDLLLYDAKDLTTHAVCVGMTGSGKTGLCLSLLEEAAIDGIPTIAIDPKGDLGNLLLTFPNLQPAEFRPWIDPSEAARRGVTPDQFAAQTSESWRNGLAAWGQDGSRIARFRGAADVAIYTPGSNAGLPVSVLRSLTAPPPALVQDADALRDRVLATVSGLLALLGMDADPIRSREHILLSNILDRAWREGRSLDIAALIAAIQRPPFAQVGVMDVETFFPSQDRFALAMTFNNLLASPGFAAWMEGEPLDVNRLLHTPDGRPRISILSIAHLTDAERMFFVTILLNEVLAWMRTQSGTTSLRALVYMDEIFGYFPPTAAPPSKLPMLTLLKQARAFGVGVVLATQNPVDLDYKGLANAGTWFIGRLQTERDKARVMEGLEGASAAAGRSFDRQRMEATLAGLGSRVFLMNNVHEDEPVIFQTRWLLSYLRGPLTRDQIQVLMTPRKTGATAVPAAQPFTAPAPQPVSIPVQPAPPPPQATVPSANRPILPGDVQEVFLPAKSAGGAIEYRPGIVGTARLHFVDAKLKLDTWQTVNLMVPLAADSTDVSWGESSELTPEQAQLRKESVQGAAFAPTPPVVTRAQSYATWKKSLGEHLYQHRTLPVFTCAALKLASSPGEAEGDFKVRLDQALRERRDAEVERLRKSYASKFATLRQRQLRAQERVDREKAQYEQQKTQTAISFGATLLGAFLGRKAISASSVGRATTAARGLSRSAKEKGDIGLATENVGAVQQQLADLQKQFDEEVANVQGRLDVSQLTIERAEIRPRKGDISVGNLSLVWTPWQLRTDGTAEPVY